MTVEFKKLLKRGVKIVLAVVGVGLCIGCGSGKMKSHIERKIARQLPSVLGPADSYQVHISASVGQLMSGKMNSLTVTADSVFMREKLEAEHMVFVMEGVRFSVSSKRFESAQSARITAHVRSDQLQRYLIRKYPDIAGIRCKLKPGKFYLYSRPSVLGISMALDSEGTLQISGKDAISANLTKVLTAGKSVPAFVTNFISKRINPVFEMSELGLPADITQLEVLDNKAIIKAQTGFITMEDLEN